MRIGELAARTGLTAHTIRYYERIGLLPPAGRDPAGRRDYDAAILAWIDFLGRLKTTGMPIRDMLRYARLRAEGPSTLAEREALLVAHRRQVRARVAALTASLRALDTKIAGYADRSSTEPSHDGDRHDRNRHDQTRNDDEPGRPLRKGPAGAL